MSVAEHLVAHTRGGDVSLTRGERAMWLWQQLRNAFPGAFGSTLMPDHHHLVVPPGGVGRYRGVLSVFTRRFGVRFDILEPQPCNSAAILARVLRYVALNALRAGHVDDPWAWPWCTLRCLAGAAMPSWANHREVASATRTSPHALLPRLTDGADASFEPPRRIALLSLSLASAQAAVSSSLRVPPRGRSRSRDPAAS